MSSYTDATKQTNAMRDEIRTILASLSQEARSRVMDIISDLEDAAFDRGIDATHTG